ncbi:Rap1 GTPase-GDP dissociation stimulator 1-B [Madurella mycetomatis]|uniref:Rap1 GTPase-GDP dissociation stimulator 1-B n=1 Tax=Madurella mycetomatis TaxID=100816 RepID=A0A175VNS9_9PEZI|nr:Rap1 GTPase-GDP dissociation stimulator 1-B [Madurella mycetomatis]
MARTVENIAALLGSRSSSAESGEDEKSWRTAQLAEVLTAVREETVDGLASVVEKLADGARDGEIVLDFNFRRMTTRAIWQLRSFVIDCFKHDAILPFATAATLNVCVDYNQAQAQASEAGLNRVLVDIVSSARLSSCQSSLSHIMTILEFLCNQDSEPKIANPNTPALLFSLATSEKYDADLDSFMEICTPALAYLTFQDFQSVLLESGSLELLQSAFSQLYTRFDITDLDPDTAAQLKQVGNGFLTIFADISALPGFPTVCPLDSKPAQILIDWLGLPPTFSSLQTAACLSLGNLSRSDESSTALLKHVQAPLLDILSRAIPPSSSEPPVPRDFVPPLQLIHASLSFLKNLAIPPPNKPLIGASLLDSSRPLLPRIWTSTRTQPQLQFAAISLARLLLVNCPANVRCMCAPLATENNIHNNGSASNLALLATTAFSADEDPIKMEAARAASLICRALHHSRSPSSPATSEDVLDTAWTWHSASSSPSSPPPSLSSPSGSEKEATDPSNTNVRARFYASHADVITDSLLLLLNQPRFPSVRSDAIFVLALMSRSAPDGARMALRVLQAGGKDKNKMAWRILAEVITGSADLAGEFLEQIKGGETVERVEAEAGEKKDDDDGGVKVVGITNGLTLEPQQQQQLSAGGTAKMDRENAMVLVAELLRHFSEELASIRDPLEAILGKGGEQVVQGREGSSSA